MSSTLDIIYMTYQRIDDTEAVTGRRIELTREMVEAGARELIFDSALDRLAVTEDILRNALEAGGYEIAER